MNGEQILILCGFVFILVLTVIVRVKMINKEFKELEKDSCNKDINKI